MDRDEAFDDASVAPLPALADLSQEASERIRRFMADSTVRGGASPADVADLYLAQEILDDANATAYLDRRFVHGQVPDDWRELQDRLSTAYLDSRQAMTADALLSRARDLDMAYRAPRSIFDDPDEDELLAEQQTERLEDRDPNLADLIDVSRQAIERHIVSEVLCYGVAPYKVMQLREGLRTDGDERALQYLDLPFELGDRPADWDALRDRALMARARLESLGIDPAAAFVNADATHAGIETSELLAILEERDPR
ncbi:MAG: hypothetical protein U0893_11320 [Chloroflexota bacterium]